MPALDDEVWMPELSHRHDVLAQCGVHRSRRHAPAGSEVTISEDLEPGQRRTLTRRLRRSQ